VPQSLRTLTEIKRISELGDVALDAEEVDRIVAVATLHSGRPGGAGFTPPQRIVDSLALYEEDEIGGRRVEVESARYFGAGTIVEVSDGIERFTALVHRGPRLVSAAPPRALTEGDGAEGIAVRQAFAGSERRVLLESGQIDEFLSSLQAPLGGRVFHLPVREVPAFTAETQLTVRSEVRHPVNVNTASREVLELLLTNLQVRGRTDWVTRDEARAVAARIRALPLTSHRDLLEKVLIPALDEGVLSEDDLEAIYRNALNANDAVLAFATAPVCYRSWNAFSIEATAIVNNAAGMELARETIREVVHLAPAGIASWTLDTQEDFEDAIVQGRGAPWLTTHPEYVGRYDGATRPPSRYHQHRVAGRFPSNRLEDEDGEDEGDVRLEPSRSARRTNVHHFDDEWSIDGLYVEGAPFSSPLIRALETDLGLAAGFVRFWFRAPDGLSGATLFDAGEGADRNRIRLFHDASDGSLKLRVRGAELDDRSIPGEEAAEIAFPISIEADTWYHVAAAWRGTKPGDLTLLVDGRAAKRHRFRTRLAQDLDSGSTSSTLSVEDAEGFPASGALLLGDEILEYESRGSNSFRLFADPETGEPLRGRRHSRIRSHRTGESVELLGYADGLLGDLRTGGATLGSAIGYADFGVVDNKESYIDDRGQQRTGLPRFQTRIKLVADAGSPNGSRFIEAFQERGYALLWNPASDGGREIVRYRKTGSSELEALRNTPTPRIAASDLRFGLHDFPTDRSVTYLIPISLHATGAAEEGYIDPYTEEETNLARSERVQVDDEWFRYDSIEGVAGDVFLLRDHPGDLASLFPAPNVSSGGGAPGSGASSSALGASAEPVSGMQDRPGGGSGGGVGRGGSGSPPPGGQPPGGGQGPAGQMPRTRRRPSGVPGGSGGSGETPGGSGQGTQQEIWERLVDLSQFRNVDRTIDEPHAAGTEVIPCFRVIGSGPGRDDVVTILGPGGDGESAEVRHGARGDQDGYYRVGLYANVGRRYVSTVEPLFVNAGSQNPNSNQGGIYDALVMDSREMTRLLKFPSGELPTFAPTSLGFGASLDGAGGAVMVLDEIEVDAIRDVAYLVNLVDDTESLDEEATDIPLARADGLVGHGIANGSGIRFWPGDGPRLTPLPEDGGILWVGDELVGYREIEDRGFDSNDGGEYILGDCIRGILGTEPGRVRHRERCHLLGFLPVTVLDAGIGATAREIPARDTRGFAPEGYVSILGSGYELEEMIGYTFRGGGGFWMPSERLDSLRGDDPPRDGEGAGIFRGRFGSRPLAYATGDLIVEMPFRYPDRAVQECDDPALAYLQVSRRLPGAFFLSIDWEEYFPRSRLDLEVLVRIDARVPWDAIPLGIENGLFRFDRPAEEGSPNRIGMQGDRIEVRVFFRYQPGAYDPLGVSQAWKASPRLRSLRVDYLAPSTVGTREEVP
jgi:hypothetical protein